MEALLSNSKVDKLGEQLRTSALTPEILETLEQYRSEFSEAYSHVERILTDKLFLKVTGRPSKSTLSIIEKLKRINSRLSQIQDIAGCRVIATSIHEQDEIISGIQQWFANVVIDDKRNAPTHGYRAVHVLVKHSGKTVEIQIRTRLQHFWASMSEKLADLYGQEIKYGNGNKQIIEVLSKLSEQSAKFDKIANRRRAIQEFVNDAKRFKNMAAWKAGQKDLKRIDESLRDSMYKTRQIISNFDRESGE